MNELLTAVLAGTVVPPFPPHPPHPLLVGACAVGVFATIGVSTTGVSTAGVSAGCGPAAVYVEFGIHNPQI